ncbi:hypothetical protein C5Y93_13530 [Blastopirellula marina]|uniref:Uncharacterized protein n=1 Tax=Blastopirellula marina TaxID=124 RepID=A0A2S8GM04_9BACT|nr:hypothetical protein C5Y93_13530 [Blastopirellula marina]
MYCFPKAIEGAYADGLTLEIVPFSDSMDSWIATFPNRGWARGSEPAVFSMPSPSQALVIAFGEAYLVNTNDPSQCTLLDIIPVVGAMAIPERQMVVLYDFIYLEAIGPEGSRWVSPRLATDGLRDVGYGDGLIVGEGWNAAHDKWLPFEVRPEDGVATLNGYDLD